MKKLYHTQLCLSIIALFLFTTSSYAYTSLYVSDPQEWSVGGQGSIDQATLTIKPAGVYLQYELFLNFSANELGYSVEDTLEVQYYFDLPENALLNDSWLWFDDDTLVADIMDRSSAYGIYESIVNRRRDPSILTKNYGNNYNLNIFPLAGNSYRKVKISFLVPVDWSKDKVSAPIPINMLQNSYVPLKKLNLVVWENDYLVNPEISDSTNLSTVNSNVYGYCKMGEIRDLSTLKNIRFTNNNPQDIFLSTYESDDENYYQLAFKPADVFDTKNAQNYLILFDIEHENTNDFNSAIIYNALKNELINKLTDNDYFNVLYSYTSNKFASDEWVPGSKNEIEQLFDHISDQEIYNYSNLPNLLQDAIDYTAGEQGNTVVVLVTNSDNYSSQDAANTLYTYLKEYSNGSLPRISVLDMYNLGDNWNYFGGQYFQANEYLYNLLTQNTNGEYKQYNGWNGNLQTTLKQLLSVSGRLLTSFDLLTSVDDGFCYGRYNLNKQGNTFYMDETVIQTGKYYGNMPFEIQVSGMSQGEVFQKNITLIPLQSYASDTVLAQIWAGNQVLALENITGYDNAIIDEIIKLSVDNRVLSRYTAFLAIDPAMREAAEQNQEENNQWLEDDIWFDIALPVTLNESNHEQNSNTPEVQAYPNPFTNIITIALNGIDITQNSIIQVFNISGQLVKVFNNLAAGQVEIYWDGTDNSGNMLDAGVYYLTITSEGNIYTVKVIKS